MTTATIAPHIPKAAHKAITELTEVAMLNWEEPGCIDAIVSVSPALLVAGLRHLVDTGGYAHVPELMDELDLLPCVALSLQARLMALQSYGIEREAKAGNHQPTHAPLEPGMVLAACYSKVVEITDGEVTGWRFDKDGLKAMNAIAKHQISPIFITVGGCPLPMVGTVASPTPALLKHAVDAAQNQPGGFDAMAGAKHTIEAFGVGGERATWLMAYTQAVGNFTGLTPCAPCEGYVSPDGLDDLELGEMDFYQAAVDCDIVPGTNGEPMLAQDPDLAMFEAALAADAGLPRTALTDDEMRGFDADDGDHPPTVH